MRKLLRYTGIGLAGLTLLAGLVLYLLIPKRALIIFDNGTTSPVWFCTVGEGPGPTPQPSPTPSVAPSPTSSPSATVSFRGCKLVLGYVLPRDILRTDRLKTGKQKIRFISDDPQLQTIVTLDVPANAVGKQRRHIYNIRKANNYVVYTLGYGNSSVTRPQIKPLPDRTFFEFDTKFELGEGFPAKIRVPRKVTGTTVSLLGHYPIHRDRPCCQRLRDSLQHLPEYRFGTVSHRPPLPEERKVLLPPSLAHHH